MNESFRDLTPEQKYSKDGPFNDPVVRCDKCQTLLFVPEIKRLGGCTRCGNTRVGNVRVLTEEEMAQANIWVSEGKIDAAWLSLFAPYETVQPEKTEQAFYAEATEAK